MRKTKKNAESRANSSSCGVVAPKKVRDSANQNNPSLRVDSQNLRGNPPIEKSVESRGRLPRLAKGKSRNDNLGKNAESSLDSANSQNLQGGLLRLASKSRNDNLGTNAESSKKSACESLKKSLDSAPSSQELADLDALQKHIKYHFKDTTLLRTALTHKSFDKHTNNERLEFLGDAVMDLIIGEYVFRTQERGNEGDLTRIRAAMVNENSLANLANNINLGKYLFISFSENRNKGRKKPSILSDAFEALMGAIYLDGGLESARNVAHCLLEKQYKEVEIESLFVDYKSALQELTQAICGNLPKYVLLKSSGPDHSKKFTMQVLINGEEFATARGKSKKEAEQICAKIAYNRIKKERL